MMLAQHGPCLIEKGSIVTFVGRSDRDLQVLPGSVGNLVRSAAYNFKALGCIALPLLVLVLGAFPVLASQSAASAASISSLKAEASQIAQQIAAQGIRINVLSEHYDEARIQLQNVDQQLAAAKVSLAQAASNVRATRKVLRSEAVNAYVTGGTASNGIQMFLSSTSQTKLALRSEYMSVAAGGMTDTLDRLHTAIDVLSARKAHLVSSRDAVRAGLASVAIARQAAEAETAHEQAILSGVKGRLATLVAQAQAAQQAAQAQPPVGPSATNYSSSSLPSPTISPGASAAGAIAVRAAESQLGVPYVWGGATPGVGFDCSGLTMWAWSQAGVQLAHFAATQYAETTHIPLSALQPGDLLFYSYGGSIDHVTMYVGPGTMIQAEQTGTNVMFTPIWYSNLVGAGRP